MYNIMKQRSPLLCYIVALLLPFSGCDMTPSKPHSLPEAHQKFQNFLKTEAEISSLDPQDLSGFEQNAAFLFHQLNRKGYIDETGRIKNKFQELENEKDFNIPDLSDQEKKKLFRKLQAINQAGYKITVLNNTVWVYVPTKKPLFATRATLEDPQTTNKYKDRYSLNFLDTRYNKENQQFHIEYDISPARIYDIDYGYGSSSSEEYSRLSQAILQGIISSYYDVTEVTEDEDPDAGGLITLNLANGTIENSQRKGYRRKTHAPDFFVITIADIINGIETISILYLDDYKKMMSQAIPPDEFYKRYITDYRGSTKIINDIRGKHLDIREITWPEFMTKQIKNRIQFKYRYSDFKPEDEPLNEIPKLIAETMKAYDYQNYETIFLDNLRDENNKTLSRTEINSLITESNKSAEPAGKYHTIKFR